jgi:hypothetical protein
MAREGWYTDPFAGHEARWFSDGGPTSLVRDAGTTSMDAPPEEPFLKDPQLVEPAASSAEDDLRRADAQPDDPGAVVDQVWTYFTRSSGGL